MKNPLVLYHADCNDGFCAAWVARMVYPDAEFRAVQYGEPAPNVDGRDVLILDFSYPRAEILAIKKRARSFMLLDHHESARKEISDIDGCVFDPYHSGAHMAWVYIFPSAGIDERRYHDIAWIVHYVEDRDLWKFELSNSKEINAVIASYPKSFSQWEMLYERGVKDMKAILQEGIGITRYQDRLVEEMTKSPQMVDVAGHRIPSVNTRVLMSEVAGRLAENAPFAMTWFEGHGGKRYHSLRSRGNRAVDVSEVAKTLGGGGHCNAAGFTTGPKKDGDA